MLKAALLCSAICTAFVVGGPSSVTSQDKPAQVAKAVSLREVLKPFVGKSCDMTLQQSRLILHFKTDKKKQYKLDMLGEDFIRLTVKAHKKAEYVPFSSILTIITD